MTQAVVVAALRGLGVEPQPGRSVSSVVATIEGAASGRTILLRADMDGLPLTEDTGLPFASEHDGRMHACGHDTHVAMLLGAARLLIERRATWSGVGGVDRSPSRSRISAFMQPSGYPQDGTADPRGPGRSRNVTSPRRRRFGALR